MTGVVPCARGLRHAVGNALAALACSFFLVPRGIAEQPPGKAEKQPFIRPIAPMGRLFADDNVFRGPWRSVGLHRAPLHLRGQPATVPRRMRMNQFADLSPGHSAAAGSAEAHPSLEHASSQLVVPLAAMSRQSLSVSGPVSAALPLSSTGITPARASQIQAALVRFGYLTSAPTGTWDGDSVAAMRRLQADHHWQTKFAPDARALIFLGLGPDYPAL